MPRAGMLTATFCVLLAINPCGASPGAALARITVSGAGIDLSVAEDGSFEVTARGPAWRFSGNIGSRAFDISSRRGRDRAGNYHEIVFNYEVARLGPRLGTMRVYDQRPVVVFKLLFLTAGQASESFPTISSYPHQLHHLAFTSVFGGYSFEHFGTDGPWVFFDDTANTFIFSPASHYMNAALSFGSREELKSGIAAEPSQIPRQFTETAVLVIESGINRAFTSWGRFLTDLVGKRRPVNEVNFALKYLGYWTDHGAQYYYDFESRLGYIGTLLKIRDEFRAMHIPLGYLQLDSWFYPKGHDGQWRSNDALGGGTYLYRGAKDLFPEGLGGFQRRVGAPLITHNRWIDEHSPYRKAYTMSGNVSTDPRLWDRWMHFLRASGVRMYEQDWLAGPAVPGHDLYAGEAFMNAMSNAARKAGIVLQYCMPLPRHFLQGTRYSNLLTIRTSGDRFDKDHWKPFLFNGRLASALGEWPWTDVFMSTETSNLLLSVLSGASVGVGDAIGGLDRKNLKRVVRADGVIVKPDDSITPLDSAYLDAANKRDSPIVASAHTRHSGAVTSYVFAFAQSGKERTATISPAALGYGTPVFAYNYFSRRGVYLQPEQAVTFAVPDEGVYWIVVPVGRSGVGFLGDAGKFVPDGKARVAALQNAKALVARILFARGEKRLRLIGFALASPKVRAKNGVVDHVIYDRKSRLFHFDLTAKPAASRRVTLVLSANIKLARTWRANERDGGDDQVR
jgi:hypothetical protein